MKPKDYKDIESPHLYLWTGPLPALLRKRGGFRIRPCQILAVDKFKIKKNKKNLCNTHGIKENWMADTGFCPHMHLI